MPDNDANRGTHNGRGAVGEGTSESSEAAANPFVCNLCKKSYSRIDHLSRHYRSHTKEKPYACNVCGKALARADLLKRHAQSHQNDDAFGKRQNDSQMQHRSRVAKACSACAESKLRCEGTSPCPRCLQKGVACEYPQHPRKKSYLPSTSRKSGHFDGYHRTNGFVAHQTTGQRPQIPHATTPVDSASPGSRSASLETCHTSSLPQHQNFLQSVQQRSLDVPQLETSVNFYDLNTYVEPMATEAEPILDINDLALADLLNGIIMPTTPTTDAVVHDHHQNFAPRDVLDFNFSPAFGTMDLDGMPFDFDLSRPHLDHVLAQHQEVEPIQPNSRQSGQATPRVHGAISVGARAFKDSVWLWTPCLDDNYPATLNGLSLPSPNVASGTSPVDDAYFQDRLSQQTRDSILVTVLKTVESNIFLRVMSCFPSTELITNLIHNAVYLLSKQADSWIHTPSLRLNDEPPVFLTALAAFGAVKSEASELQRLGYALQENVRQSLGNMIENDNRQTRNLRVLQASALELDISLWSGNKRKMEISESFSQPTITMLRRAGHFRRSTSELIVPEAADDANTLERKYNSWIMTESFKRLALHFFSRDRQTSMSLLNPLLVSYAEISTYLPCSGEQWRAKSATKWRDVCLTKPFPKGLQLPSVRSCIEDSGLITPYSHLVDTGMAITIILSGIWSLVWQYRERTIAAKYIEHNGPRNSVIISNGLQQEILQLMQHFKLNAEEWAGPLAPEAKLLYEQCMMHIFVSLEDVQVLAGKEGEEQARRVLPLLSSWMKSRGSRQAVFHAGQVLRAAKSCATHMLCDSVAVAVYHASLVFWAYAIMSRSMKISRKRKLGAAGGQVDSDDGADGRTVRLDGTDTPELQLFLVLGRGSPTISPSIDDEDSSGIEEVPLSHPKAMMNTITNILRRSKGSEPKRCYPLVDNLSKLMMSLGNAALSIGFVFNGHSLNVVYSSNDREAFSEAETFRIDTHALLLSMAGCQTY